MLKPEDFKEHLFTQSAFGPFFSSTWHRGDIELHPVMGGMVNAWWITNKGVDTGITVRSKEALDLVMKAVGVIK